MQLPKPEFTYPNNYQQSLIIIVMLLFTDLYSLGQSLDSTNTNKSSRKNYAISGIIKDAASGETMPYVNVSADTKRILTVSNQYGFYSLTLPGGRYILIYSFMGYEDYRQEINLDKDIRLEISLSTKNEELQEVVVTDNKNNLRNIEQRLSNIDINTIKKLPSLGGEADLLRNLKLLPGVSSVASEGSGGITVRGGAYDQNLMLLDEATVYSESHLVGLYSIFNPNIIKDIKFYKSGIPASYGGRISSAMDVTQKDGNMKSFHANASLGLIASDLTIEGPIIKDKSSFIIGARRSYIDIFFKYVPNDKVKDVNTYFYDLNSKVNYIINKNNRLYLSCYMGNDLTGVSNYKSEYGNITGTLRYNHIFNNRLFSNTSIIISKYKMVDGGSSNEWAWANRVGLDHYEFKNAFTYFTTNHSIEFGLDAIYYTFHPGDLQPVGDSSKTFNMKMPKEYALQPSVYLSDNYRINSNIELQYGLRFSNYNYLGSSNIYIYADDEPKDPSTIIDTVSYNTNEVIQSYNNFEPRVSLKIGISENHSIKLSYNRMSQYIQQISNTVSPLPYNMWKASNNYVKPLISDQYAIGYFSDLFKNKLELSFEMYYKSLTNVIDVKPGTDISLNRTIESGILQGTGRAYGIEIMVSKTKGSLTGMLSYTWSRSEKRINSNFKEERVNLGNYYPSDYDIPNKITFAAEYKMSKRFSFTSDFTYQTGRPITLPSGQYYYFNTLIPYYSDKNMQRLPAFHRLDIGAVLKSKPRENKKWDSYWTFSLYNVYGRKNVFSMYIRRVPGTKNTEAVQMWAFSVIPSISYNFKF